METFVTVAVILGMIVVGVVLIRLLNSQHGDRMAAIHYGHTGMPVAGPAPRKARGRRERAAPAAIAMIAGPADEGGSPGGAPVSKPGELTDSAGSPGPSPNGPA
ncbi:hypothetical protein GCM10010313_50710 [Streptomyces violarus]|uniref:Uncharacterized protein n=1 Tax=Streptomyces violarus TaxID=67380 RepID=A0A7W4ZSZ8_9ACTN|nr:MULTISPECIES: hypothetical protein [Streptomyces]MBB3078058.1 hypothetical protein [Streptomyces violarus]WRT99782.1 hypothetical protein VJ737_19680 [Streptomyces sp. CGMCC 4.1772]GHD19472.1 hypothetical protein GCM10010313_50710 [Streptomyces violarus]